MPDASAHRYNTWLIKLIEQEVTSPSLVRVTLSRLPPSPGFIPFLLFKLPKRVFNCGFIHRLALLSLALILSWCTHTDRERVSGAFHSALVADPFGPERRFVLFQFCFSLNVGRRRAARCTHISSPSPLSARLALENFAHLLSLLNESSRR